MDRIIELLYSFLERRNLTNKFLSNVTHYTKCSYPAYMIIGWTFDWSITPEGRDFWYRVSEDWISFIHHDVTKVTTFEIVNRLIEYTDKELWEQ